MHRAEQWNGWEGTSKQSGVEESEVCEGLYGEAVAGRRRGWKELFWNLVSFRRALLFRLILFCFLLIWLWL